MKQDIRSMLPDEILAATVAMGEKPFRAKQLWEWVSKGAKCFEEMTNLPKTFREKLDTVFYFPNLTLIQKQRSRLDGTVKLLWQLEDGNTVESVVMRYRHGNTVCISTQVGCRMGCSFCASTIGGLVRNLEPSEMLEQVRRSGEATGLPIGNVVLMGIGEPLDNFDNVMRFLSLVNLPEGLHIGMRHITLSTCGLTEVFDKLGNYTLQLTLSVSLHAPDDATRSKLMPVNRERGIDRLMTQCRRYYKKCGRRISFEYAMIKGVNDTPGQGRLLAQRMLDVGGHVNLIPLNHVTGRAMSSSSEEAIGAFARILTDRGVNVTVRRRLGSDIDASCGQLRRKREGH